MEMQNSGLSASDVLAMTRDNDGFGGVGLIILLFIFLIGIGGNGFGWGNNGTATALSLADIQAVLLPHQSYHWTPLLSLLMLQGQLVLSQNSPSADDLHQSPRDSHSFQK